MVWEVVCFFASLKNNFWLEFWSCFSNFKLQMWLNFLLTNYIPILPKLQPQKYVCLNKWVYVLSKNICIDSSKSMCNSISADYFQPSECWAFPYSFGRFESSVTYESVFRAFKNMYFSYFYIASRFNKIPQKNWINQIKLNEVYIYCLCA